MASRAFTESNVCAYRSARSGKAGAHGRGWLNSCSAFCLERPASCSLDRVRQRVHTARVGSIDTSGAHDCWPPTCEPTKSCAGGRLLPQRISRGRHPLKSSLNILKKSDRKGSPEVLT